MATRLKLFTSILVIICIIQFVQMAPEIRIRRDKPTADIDLDSALKKAQEEFNKFLDNENTKKLMDAASNVLQEIGKAVENQLNGVKEKISTTTT